MKQNTTNKSPFGEGRALFLTADIEAGGGSYGFAKYAHDYFCTAHLLIWNIAKAGTNEWIEWKLDKGDAENLLDWVDADRLFYPVIFLYRHGAELMAKHFLYDKPNAPGFSEAARKHDLQKLWEEARKELTDFFGNERAQKAGLEKLDTFVKNICELDRYGDESRFPIKFKNKEKSYQKYDGARIDLESVYDSAVEAEEIFMSFVEGRMEEWADMSEAIAYSEIEE